ALLPACVCCSPAVDMLRKEVLLNCEDLFVDYWSPRISPQARVAEGDVDFYPKKHHTAPLCISLRSFA
ncbi:MAG: hypothetical protein ACK5YO_09440, partial [Planctomyces sp.]